jgi:hypothetical protein
VILKIVPKACHGFMPEKLTNDSKAKLEQKFDAPSEAIFRISKCFQRSKQKIVFIFLLNKPG